MNSPLATTRSRASGKITRGSNELDFLCDDKVSRPMAEKMDGLYHTCFYNLELQRAVMHEMITNFGRIVEFLQRPSVAKSERLAFVVGLVAISELSQGVELIPRAQKQILDSLLVAVADDKLTPKYPGHRNFFGKSVPCSAEVIGKARERIEESSYSSEAAAGQRPEAGPVINSIRSQLPTHVPLFNAYLTLIEKTSEARSEKQRARVAFNSLNDNDQADAEEIESARETLSQDSDAFQDAVAAEGAAKKRIEECGWTPRHCSMTDSTVFDYPAALIDGTPVQIVYRVDTPNKLYWYVNKSIEALLPATDAALFDQRK